MPGWSYACHSIVPVLLLLLSPPLLGGNAGASHLSQQASAMQRPHSLLLLLNLESLLGLAYTLNKWYFL